MSRAAPLLLLLVAVAGGCASSPRYRTGGAGSADGGLYSSRFYQKGIASYYGRDFHGKRTANGEIYDMNGLTAAHRTLPFSTVLEVRNLENDRTVTVRINDRGPFVQGRIIDLSVGAARRIGMLGSGTAMVELRVKKWGEQKP
jgi:rare lipoprotein A